MVFSQLLPFVAITWFGGVCFRSQRLRLARLMGEFSDGFLTVVAITAPSVRSVSGKVLPDTFMISLWYYTYRRRPICQT